MTSAYMANSSQMILSSKYARYSFASICGFSKLMYIQNTEIIKYTY